MNNYDLMVGGGISSLLGNGHSDVAAPGAFDFAQRSEPVVRMAYGGEAESQFEDVYRPEATPTYSDEQIAQAMQESMKQGFSLEDTLLGAQQKYGIAADQLARAQNLFTPAQPAENIVSNLQTAGLQETTQPNIPLAPKTTPTAGAGTTLIDAFNYAQQNLGSRPDAISVDVDPSIGVPFGVGAKTQFGNYTITALGNPVYEDVITGYDPYTGAEVFGQKQVGSDVTGYTIEGIAGKTDKGIDYESSITVDRTGKITGRLVDYKTGGDSGTRIWYDENGKPVDAQGYDKSERWRKPTALIAAGLATMFGVPIGEFLAPYLGGSAIAGAAASGALFGGAQSAISGAEGSDILKGAAVGAASGAVGKGFGQVAGEAAGKAVGSEYSNIVSGAVKGGVQALPGAIATGDYGQVGIGALMGGATAAGSGAISDALKEYGIKPTQVQAGVNIARALASGNTTAVINSLGALTNNKDVNIASKAYVALNALRGGNPIAATAAIIQLGDAMSGPKAKAPAVKTADVGGGPFETSAIFEGTEGGGTSEQDFMGLLGTLGDQAGDYPGQEAGPRMFNASGQMIVAPKGEFIDLPDGRYIDDRGVIYKPDNTLWSPSGTLTDPYAATDKVIGSDQAVNILGESYGLEDVGIIGDPNAPKQPPGVIEGPSRIEVRNTPVRDIEDLGQVEIVGDKDVADQPPGVIEGPSKIFIDNTSIKDLGIETIDPVDLSDIIKSLKDIVIPTPPGTTTPGTKPDTKTPITTTPTTKTAQTAALAAAAKNLYALPGDLPLFKSVFYEMERQKELARQAKEIENADKDPYERLMELAEEDPEMAVGKLMQIIEGGQRG